MKAILTFVDIISAIHTLWCLIILKQFDLGIVLGVITIILTVLIFITDGEIGIFNIFDIKPFTNTYAITLTILFIGFYQFLYIIQPEGLWVSVAFMGLPIVYSLLILLTQEKVYGNIQLITILLVIIEGSFIALRDLTDTDDKIDLILTVLIGFGFQIFVSWKIKKSMEY